jgi:mannosyltransferase
LPASPMPRAARARWSQVAGWLLIAVLLPGQVAALRHLYTDPAFVRDDYRAIAASITELGRPGDAILLNAPNQWEVFTYYYQGPLPVYPAPYRVAQHQAEAWVTDTLSQHAGGRLFVLFWGDGESDPDRSIEGALAQQAYKAGDRWIASVRLASYGLHPLPTGPMTPVNISLDTSVLLEGYIIPTASWIPGDIVPLTLFWTTDAPLAERYKVFIHVVDGTGALVGQTDLEPHTGFRPTTTWLPGESIVDHYGIALPSELAPGSYALHVGMYGLSGERLRVTEGGRPAGDFIRLEHITVTAPR